MRKILRYIKGYLEVYIKSDEPERFFNICRAKNIETWNVFIENTSYTFNILIDDFYKLKEIAKKTNTKVRIHKKKGYPFFVYKNRRRKAYLVGIITFLAVIYTLSLFVWDIHFEGMYTYTEDVMLEYLAEKNIRHGSIKSDIDCTQIEKMLRNDFFDITWVSVSLEGTRLTIHIQENYDYDIVDENEFEMSDIIADKEGIISSIITRSGTPLVKTGDAVKEKDILVSGNVVVNNEYGELIKNEYGNADADILAQTVYNYNESMSIRHKIKVYTGNSKKSYGITIFNKSFYIFSQKAGYDECDRTVEQKQFKLGKNFYLPIYFYEISYNEYNTKTEKYTEENARTILEKNIDDFFEELIEKGVQIIENNVTIRREGSNYIAEGDVVVIENFGKSVSVEDLYRSDNAE